MSARREEQFEAPGKDSFLDVVANVVAILIILVIVVGSQASQIVVQKATAQQQAMAAGGGTQGDVSRAEADAQSMENGVHELEQRLHRQQFEVAYRQAERERIQLLVTVAEQRLTEYRDQLGQEDREKYDLEQELLASRGELQKLSQPDVSGKPPPIVLQHLPTPMARTVFSGEINFRLQGGRLAYVPWEEMMTAMKADAPKHIEKLRDMPRAEFSLPVINGFGARYILRRADLVLQTKVGPARQGAIELEKIYFVDAETGLGQPVAQALVSGSELRTRLATLRPQNTTVTVWVYQDSFDEFRAIKSELFKLGYLCAARPMPTGHPIGASPDGSRSAAE